MSRQPLDWNELTRLTQGQPFAIERVRLTGRDICIEGSFELPQLARLTLEDQVFVTAFVRCHGSLKEMERIFGISYPTVKSRLNRIAGSLEFVETDVADTSVHDAGAAAVRAGILGRLGRREISAQDAIRELEALK